MNDTKQPTEQPDNIMNAAALGAALAEPRKVGDMPFLMLPPGYTFGDLSHMRYSPQRKKGTVTLRDKDSFVRMVKVHKSDATNLYGSYTPPSFTAVFNDHGADSDDTGWQDHRAVFNCPLSVEWKTWLASSGKQMGQEAFAQFIEDNLPDIANPPAADMLEISRSLEAKKKVNFASGIRLSNGENELTYEEQISGTAAKGKITVPELFTLGIPVLENGARYAVDCRLRYRIADGGKLAMWYEIVRPHKIVEDAIKEVWTEIENEIGCEIFNGTIG